MHYRVVLKNRARKMAFKMPSAQQENFDLLVQDLKRAGPVLPDWPNYSRLSESTYHCHLSYKWVACWKHEKGTIEIEVYYAGSRENAPY